MTFFTSRHIQRLRTSSQFRRVYAEHRLFRSQWLDVYIAGPSGGAGCPARLGISIRRAAARVSVKRNQLKRWVREVFRRHPEVVMPGYDIVVSARLSPPSWRYQDVEAAVVALLTDITRRDHS